MEMRTSGQIRERSAELSRVSVETGIRAYQVTGAQPARGLFATFTRPAGANDVVLDAACGIGVLVEAGFIRRLTGETHYNAAEREFGQPYAEAFSWGFDGQRLPADRWSQEPDRERMFEGQRDGRALWETVKAGVPFRVPDFPPAGWASITVAGEEPSAIL